MVVRTRRKKPFRALTKNIDFVRAEQTDDGLVLLFRDQWQFYASLIPKGFLNATEEVESC